MGARERSSTKVPIWQRALLALLIAFVLGMIGGILESNLVQGEYKSKFGTVPVPGARVLHLPATTVDVAYAVLLPGRGNETPDVPVPRNLELSVEAVEPGAPKPIVEESVGGSANSSAPDTDTDIRLWRVVVREDGDYRVTVRGGSPKAVNPTLELGTGPLVPIGYVWVAALIIGILVAIFWPQILSVRGHRKTGGTPPQDAAAPADGDARFQEVDARLRELDELHSRGVISDAEYSAEQSRVIDEI